MMTVYLALGSNVGDARAYIQQAVALLTTIIDDLKRAPLYLSRAVGYTDQSDFINTVVSGTTDLAPADLLNQLKNIEQQIGRTTTFRHGPREIDIDIIFYGNQIMQSDRLTVPHPHFQERDFVLQPLNDLNAALADPLSGQSVADLLAQIPAGQRSIIRRIDDKP